MHPWNGTLCVLCTYVVKKYCWNHIEDTVDNIGVGLIPADV